MPFYNDHPQFSLQVVGYLYEKVSIRSHPFFKKWSWDWGWLMYALPLTVGKSEMFFYNRCFQEPFSLNIHSADVNYWCCKKLHLITIHSTELSHVENEPSKMRLRTQINVNWNQLLRIMQTGNKKLTTEMLSSLFVFSTLI